jgi:hypothetical protein
MECDSIFFRIKNNNKLKNSCLYKFKMQSFYFMLNFTDNYILQREYIES